MHRCRRGRLHDLDLGAAEQATAQREQLIRRLAAKDSSIDLMSIDPPFVPEFAEARFLLGLPEDAGRSSPRGGGSAPVQSATWKDELVRIPFWANTQLLWYRKSVAQEAGLDLAQPVTWQQLIDAAGADRHDRRGPGRTGTRGTRCGSTP